MAFMDRFKGEKKTEPKKKPTAPAKGGSASGGKKQEAATELPEKQPAKVIAPIDSRAHQVLVHPIVSEKTSALEAKGQYVFVVRKNANKVEIKKAVEQHYKVHVTRVNVVNVMGKSVRYGRSQGTRSDWRKAYVVLKHGESLVY